MKIVVLDGYTENPGDLSWAPLEALGDVTVYDRTAYTESPLIAERIGNADVVVTNKTPISRATLEACPGMKLVAVLATGYNVVDCAAAKEKGIPVVNVPAYGTAAVAQFTIGLLLEIALHIGQHNESVHNGEWERSEDFCYWKNPMMELAGKTMGFIGFGRIGQSVAAIAKALGMRIIAYNRSQCESGRALAEYVDLDTLLATADVISLHCPLFPETQGIINRNSIAKMKDGVILLNTGRGPLIVEQDLADALESGKVAAAGLDVVSTEPIMADNPLLKAKNCIITPHIAWAPIESRRRIMDITAENIRAFLAGAPINVVNG